MKDIPLRNVDITLRVSDLVCEVLARDGVMFCMQGCGEGKIRVVSIRKVKVQGLSVEVPSSFWIQPENLEMLERRIKEM